MALPHGLEAHVVVDAAVRDSEVFEDLPSRIGADAWRSASFESLGGAIDAQRAEERREAADENGLLALGPGFRRGRRPRPGPAFCAMAPVRMSLEVRA